MRWEIIVKGDDALRAESVVNGEPVRKLPEGMMSYGIRFGGFEKPWPRKRVLEAVEKLVKNDIPFTFGCVDDEYKAEEE